MTTVITVAILITLAYFYGRSKGIELGRKEGSQYIIEIKKK